MPAAVAAVDEYLLGISRRRPSVPAGILELRDDLEVHVARATSAEQTGSAGASEATALFVRIGWGFAEIFRHDNGIDVFLMARDERLFDLGLTLGAQIKAGPSYFARPKRHRGKTAGWWFVDPNGEHLRDLVEHGLPQLLVLYHLETRVAYWVHVTADAIVKTGRGSKILLPVENTVDEGHRSELLAIASSARGEVQWEGTAWTGHGDLGERAELRTALIAPRLVAPHANLGHSKPITAVQAIAILMQCRVDDYAAFAEQHESVPTLDEAATATDWAWRLVAALGKRVLEGNHEALRASIADAPTDFQRAAATALVCGCLMANDSTDEALHILERELDSGSHQPIDHEWLTLQRARALGEVGRIADARRSIAEIQGFSRHHRGDACAAAIDGAASQLLFRLSDIWTGEVGLAIKGRDTAVSWWRQQTRSWGLGTALDRSFESWGRDRRQHLMRGDGVVTNLLSAALTATVLGDHDDWRYLTEALGRWGVMQAHVDDAEAVQLGLSNLRLAGDEQGLELALNRLVDEGPADQVRAFAQSIDLSRSTRTSARADLCIIRAAADTLDSEFADRHVDELLALRVPGTSFEQRTTYRPPWYDTLQSLAKMVKVASLAAQGRVLDGLLVDPGMKDQLVADRWSIVVGAIARSAWTDARRDLITSIAKDDAVSEHLRSALHRVLIDYNPAEREQLLGQIRSGSVAALAAFGDISELPADVAKELMSVALVRMETQRTQASQGMWGIGGPDFADVVVLLNILHPRIARWDELFDYLHDPNIRRQAKSGSMHRLASHHEALSVDVVDRLRPIIATLRELASPPLIDMDEPPASYYAAIVLLGVALELDDADVSGWILELAAGSELERVWGARLAGKRMAGEDLGVIIMMSTDTHAAVRAASGIALVRVAARSRATQLSTAALRLLVRDRGLTVPLSLAQAVKDEGIDTSGLEGVVAALASHPLALVRARLADAAMTH